MGVHDTSYCMSPGRLNEKYQSSTWDKCDNILNCLIKLMFALPLLFVLLSLCGLHVQCKSKKSLPLWPAVFWHFFDKRLRILNQFFTHVLYVPIYVTLPVQIFIQLSQTLTKLCHIKRDYLVHVICSKCPQSAETRAFRRLRKSLIALLIVVFGKSCQICCFYNVNKHVGYDMTSTVTSFAQ